MMDSYVCLDQLVPYEWATKVIPFVVIYIHSDLSEITLVDKDLSSGDDRQTNAPLLKNASLVGLNVNAKIFVPRSIGLDATAQSSIKATGLNVNAKPFIPELTKDVYTKGKFIKFLTFL